MSRYQKGKTSLNFTEVRDSDWQWHQQGHMQVCTLLQTDNHTRTPPLLCFLQAGCPSCCPTNSIKALEAINTNSKYKRNKNYSENLHICEKSLLCHLQITAISLRLQSPMLKCTLWVILKWLNLTASKSTNSHTIKFSLLRYWTVFSHNLTPGFLWSTSWPRYLSINQMQQLQFN